MSPRRALPDKFCDRIRIRGGANGTAGLWLSGSQRTNAAFIGLVDDGFVGLWGGGGANWSLLMNTTNGNLGIGTSNPDWPLSIKGTGANWEWLSFKNTSGTTKWHLNGRNGGLNFAETAAADGRLFLASGGDVGIGTTDPQYKLHVMGDIALEGDFWMKHDDSGGISRWYRLTASADNFPGSGAWDDAEWWEASRSDQRLKQNISTIPDALGKLERLRGVAFNWNETALKLFTRDLEKNSVSASRKPEDNQKLWAEMRRKAEEKYAKPQLGFIAQEVEQVFPDWVSTGADGYKAINMEHLSAILVNAVKEQQTQIQALQQKAAKVAALEQELTALKQQMAAQQQAAATWEARFSSLEKVMTASRSGARQSRLAENTAP